MKAQYKTILVEITDCRIDPKTGTIRLYGRQVKPRKKRKARK